ncbi:MAG: DUF4232 domain-containing protein [Dactylosporangium sp.]|nr:DUF4232 domain-containing protein [Dactylosporangium sp.]NNJ62490.1 DUF4232 domain-containing protein [Dactylosporangium sp.]
MVGAAGILAMALAVPAVPAAAAAAPNNAGGHPAPRWCATHRLDITAGPEDGAAGTLYLPLSFANTSSGPCVLYGYPRVAYVTGPHGSQVNDEATPGTALPLPLPLVLAPGARAVATLSMPQAQNYDPETCQPVQVGGIRVAPPNNRVAVFISYPTTVCSVSGVGVPGITSLELG